MWLKTGMSEGLRRCFPGDQTHMACLLRISSSVASPILIRSGTRLSKKRCAESSNIVPRGATLLMAGAAGFGGASLLVQVRAALGGEVLPLRTQVLRQALHGALAFLLALGMAFFVQ